MAAGNYQVDLTVINLAETNTDWNDINQAGGGGANTAEVDFAIQGTNAITRQVSNTRRGVLYDFGSTITLGADDHIYTWTVCSTPGIVENKSIGGIRVSVGTSTTAYYDYYVNGGDTLPEGGMNNYVVYYAAASASLTNGSPGANPQFFGAQADTNATARNVNFACDAIRYGTGYYIFDGDSTNPITFASASQDNDLTANRYGVFTAIPGGFSQKGRFAIGQTTASVATQAYFDDANTTVQFADTEFAQADFTQIRIDHPSTFANFRNITFLGLGTKNPGQFNFLDSSTVGNLDGCTFNSIGTTQLQAAVTASSTWIGCSTVNQSGSIINASTFNNTSAPVSALVSDRPDRVTNSTFISTGTKHGIEVTAAGNYVFTGNTLTGFDSGSNANEFLYFNPTGGTGDLTLTVVSGNGTIEFRNASSGTVTIVNSVTVTLTGLKDNTEVRIFESTNSYPQTELAGIEDATDGTTDDRSFSFSLEIGTVVDIVIHNKDYKYLRIEDFELTETQDLPVTQIFDRNYSNTAPPLETLTTRLITSIKARAEFFENESATTTFLTDIGDELLNSASLVMHASGYSSTVSTSGSIQSLIPSSSDGDLVCDIETVNENVEANYEGVHFINSNALITSSSTGVPKLGYNYLGSEGHFYNIGIQQTKMQHPINFSSSFGPGKIFFNPPLSSSTVDYVAYANTTTTTGSISPLGDDSATLIIDNNSGGINSASVAFTSTRFDVQRNIISFFASSSGADYVWCSSSALPSSFWFNLQTGQTGSVEGTQFSNDFIVTEYPNKWWRIAAPIGGTTRAAEDFVIGAGVSDGSKTFTSDGTKGISIWGFNNSNNGYTAPFQGNFVNVVGQTTIVPPNQHYYSNLTTPCSNDGGALYLEYKGIESFGINTDDSTGADAIGLTLQSTGTTTDFCGILQNSDSGTSGKDGIVLRWTSGSTATDLETTRVKITGSYIDGYNYKYNLNGDYSRVAISWTPTSWKVSINGEIKSDLVKSVSFVPAYDQFRVEGEARVKSVMVFPNPLTNDQLNTLTL